MTLATSFITFTLRGDMTIIVNIFSLECKIFYGYCSLANFDRLSTVVCFTFMNLFRNNASLSRLNKYLALNFFVVANENYHF